MKKVLLFLSLLIAFTNTYAQDCSSSEDCLQQGKSSNFSKQKREFFTKGLKYAKKEKVSQAPLYFYRGVSWYNQSTSYTKEAMKDFKASIKADPNYYAPYSWVSSVFQTREKDYKKGLQWADVVIERFPNNPQAYYDRGHMHRYFQHNDLAIKDFETAYNMLIMLMDGADELSTFTKGEICRWYTILYMKTSNIYVYDQKALEILETGAQLVPDSPILLGELALAYYDMNNMTKAQEIGRKARDYDADTYNSKNVGGNYLYGMQMYEAKELFKAASHCGYANGNLKHPHPAVHYYKAITSWEYYVSIFDSNPSLWTANIGQIKENLRLTIQYGTGTKYQYLADAAKKNLEQLQK